LTILTANLCWKGADDLPVQLLLKVQVNQPCAETDAPKRSKRFELLGSTEAAMQKCIVASQTLRKRMQLNRWRRFPEQNGSRSEGYTMFRRLPRRSIEALPTQGIALIVALGRSDLRVTKQTQSKSIELSGSHLTCEMGRLRWEFSTKPMPRRPPDLPTSTQTSLPICSRRRRR
jgi:hypothetical protein